jgi:hypothetical protein
LFGNKNSKVLLEEIPQALQLLGDLSEIRAAFPSMYFCNSRKKIG